MLEHGGGLCGCSRGGESRAGTVGCREDLGLGPEGCGVGVGVRSHTSTLCPDFCGLLTDYTGPHFLFLRPHV